MAEFQLDTSGIVRGRNDGHLRRAMGLLMEDSPVRWADLSPFVQGYVEALFASFSAEHHSRPALKVGDKVRVHTDEVGTVSRIITGKTKSIQVQFADGGGQYFPFECRDAPLSFSDVAPETLARIIEDCATLARRAGYMVPTDAEQGAITWRQRQKGEISDFPPLTVTLGGDGKVVFP